MNQKYFINLKQLNRLTDIHSSVYIHQFIMWFHLTPKIFYLANILVLFGVLLKWWKKIAQLLLVSAITHPFSIGIYTQTVNHIYSAYIQYKSIFWLKYIWDSSKLFEIHWDAVAFLVFNCSHILFSSLNVQSFGKQNQKQTKNYFKGQKHLSSLCTTIWFNQRNKLLYHLFILLFVVQSEYIYLYILYSSSRIFFWIVSISFCCCCKL